MKNFPTGLMLSNSDNLVPEPCKAVVEIIPGIEYSYCQMAELKLQVEKYVTRSPLLTIFTGDQYISMKPLIPVSIGILFSNLKYPPSSLTLVRIELLI